MPRSRRKHRPSGGVPRRRRRLEWIGGILSSPFLVEERNRRYRPGFVLWLSSSGFVVGHDVVAPEDAEGAVASVLLEAFDQPLAGPRRRPDVIRVATPELAEEVHTAVADTIPVVIAPTPELGKVMQEMLEHAPDMAEKKSYLEDDRVQPQEVAELFAAAESLYRVAPWKAAYDSQVLEMDIPALGIKGACISIIGNLGESFGAIVFPSIAAYGQFVEAASGQGSGGRNTVDYGTGWISLSFERGAELPPGMRREALAHGWPVAGPEAYPFIMCIEGDGAPRVVSPWDLKILTLCAAALRQFFDTHWERVESDSFDPVRETYRLPPENTEVRLSYPCKTTSLFEIDEGFGAEPAALDMQEWAETGRNDPCPCGSGRKYKKCCLAKGAPDTSPALRTKGIHEVDNAVLHHLYSFAEEQTGSEWRDFENDFHDASEELGLARHWAIYHFRVDGSTVASQFLERHANDCSPPAVEWVRAQQASWVSAWEVTAIERGRSLTLQDLLSGEERLVLEEEGSKNIAMREVLLARIVDFKGVSFLCGSHSRPLPPLHAAEVVRLARVRLRRKRAIPVDLLRDEAFGRYLIRRWEWEVEEMGLRSRVLPEMRNMDGDPLLWTVDHFRIAPGAGPDVEARIAALDGVVPSEDDGDSAYSFVRQGRESEAVPEEIVVGRATVSDKLRLETNSRERADALRSTVEAVLGDRIEHLVREHADPLSDKAVEEMGDSRPETLPPEAEQFALEFKRRHYAEWIDQPIPALNGRTPRESVRSADGRRKVDALLKEAEYREHRSNPDRPFDFTETRRELGLD